jgi:hypothetical protein
MKKKLGALSGIIIIIIIILLNRQQHIPITPDPTSTPTPTPAEGRIASIDTESEPEPTPTITPTPTPTPTPTIVDIPPQIISYDIPEEVESYERFGIDVVAEDDIEVTEVFVEIEGLDRIILTEKSDSWQGNSKIRTEGEYPYTITAVDSSGQEATAEDVIICISPIVEDDDEGYSQPDGNDYLPY